MRVILLCGAALACAGQTSTLNKAPSQTSARIAVVFAPHREAVLSAEVSARVQSIKLELGEAFNADDLLVALDDTVYRANLTIAEARRDAARDQQAAVGALTEARTRERHARAMREAARKKLDVTQKLFDDGHASQIELVDAQRELAAAEADCEVVRATVIQEQSDATRNLATATARHDLAVRELDACHLTAPYAGRVARILVHEHELVDRGTPLIEIVDDRTLRARFLVPSRWFGEVRLGQDVAIRVTETDDRVTGHVSHIAATLDPASATFEVYAEVDNADARLRAGMNGWLMLERAVEASRD